LSQQQTWWTEILVDFYINIEYRPGTGNIVVDALSCQVNHCYISTVQQDIHLASLLDNKYGPDLDLGPIYKALLDTQSYSHPANLLFPKYKLTSNLLLYKGCVLNHLQSLKTTLMSKVHNTPVAGHPGINHTLKSLKTYFYWPCMKAEVTNYVHSCDTCQHVKNNQLKTAGLLQPLPIPIFL
jgi:hypothetical protein